MSVEQILKKTHESSRVLALSTASDRNAVLKTLAVVLNESVPHILKANAHDLSVLSDQDRFYHRLKLTESSIQSMIHDLRTVSDCPDPLNRILSISTRSNGLRIQKISVPFGVVAVIYESRPNVTIDAFALCFKSGNACVLKGGKEAQYTNQIFLECIQKALRMHHHAESNVCLFHQKTVLSEILRARSLIDVCIPRGSHALIRWVRQEAQIPVIETGAGVVHAYFDVCGDVCQSALLIENAKTRRPEVCNALDCLLVHSARLIDLPQLVAPLQAHSVVILADESAFRALHNHYPIHLLRPAQEDAFGMEFLSNILAIKTVSSWQDSVEHIQRHGSGHSEMLFTENPELPKHWMQAVDAAVVYHNASSAFTDGAQFGLGSEIGISTQKLHARGPMGLEALTTYRWFVYGTGQIRV